MGVLEAGDSMRKGKSLGLGRARACWGLGGQEHQGEEEEI